MDRLAGVFFEMRASNTDALFVAVCVGDEQLAVLNDGQLVLADLVALRQIRVEVVLARKHRSRRDCRIYREPELAAMRTTSSFSTGRTPG